MNTGFQALKGHCAYVYDTLIAKLFNKAPPAWPATLPSKECPLFVSYYKGKPIFLTHLIYSKGVRKSFVVALELLPMHQ